MIVYAIQGSLGEPSRTAALLTLVSRILGTMDAEVDVFDVRANALPLVNPQYHDDPSTHPSAAVREFTARARAADAMIWATPVYHNSYSGALKQAIDHLSLHEVLEKPIALCGNGGRGGSTQPTDHLRIVARSLHGIAIPTVCVTRSADFVADGGRFLLQNREIVYRAERMARQLAEYMVMFARLRASRREAEPKHA